MKYLRYLANPVVMGVLICGFLYLYFFYTKDSQPFSSSAQQTAGAYIQQNDPNAIPLAAPSIQDRNPASPQSPFNGTQGNQNDSPFTRPDSNAPLQPIPVPAKTLQEGHWIGFEVIPLTPAIAKANHIPPDVSGVLIDEVTLLSAEAGLYAGDVVTAINGKRVDDLKSFWQATKDVAQSNRATVSVYSGGHYKDVVVFSTEVLGVAQMEAAPMILATDKSPHAYYGPCDKCHAISRTPVNAGQMAKDLGDSLTKVAPNIRIGTPPPHRNRGTCTTCHVILGLQGGALQAKPPIIMRETPPPQTMRAGSTQVV